MRYTAAAVAVLQLSAVVGTVWSFQLHHQQPCINGRRRLHRQWTCDNDNVVFSRKGSKIQPTQKQLITQALYATDTATDDVTLFDEMLEKFAAPLEFKETSTATDKVNDNAVSITGADDTASSTLSDKLTATKAAASKVMQQADEHVAATTQTKAVETQQKVEDKEQVVDENMVLQIDNKKEEAAVTKTVAQETKAIPQPISEKKEQKEQTTPDSSQQQQQEEEATTTLPTPTIETKTPFGPIVVPRRGFSDFGSPERKEPKIKMDFGDDEMTKMKPTALGVNPNRKKIEVKMDKDDGVVTQEQKSAPKIEVEVTKAGESKAQVTAAAPPETNAKETAKSVVTEEKTSPVMKLAPSATDMTPSSTATPDLVKTQSLSPTLTMPTLPESLRNVNLDDPGIITGGVVLLGFTLYFALVQNMNRTDNKEEGGADDETKNLLQKVKDAGVAGAISYACWELAFWGISIPVCIVGYNKFTGHWPDLSNADDLKQLGAEIFAFTNVARLAVPLRIGLALSTTPWIDANVVQKLQRNDEQEEVDANGLQEQTFVEGSDFGDMVTGNEEEPRWSDDDDEFQHEEMMLYEEDKEEDFSPWSHVEERLSNIEEAVQVASGLGPMQVEYNNNYEERMASLPGAGYLNYIDEFCEPGTRSSNCAGAIKGYLDGLASSGAVASNREVNTIVGYLDSLSSNPMPNGTSRTGAAFTSYLDALSSGTAPSPPSAEAVAGYLDDLTNTDTRAADIESRLNKLESSISTLPDDIAYRIVGWQESQDKKMSEELEKIKKMLEGVKSVE